MKALLIDHDDSFTYNLRDWLRPGFSEVQVRNHLDLEVKPNADTLVVLSPGPKSPNDYAHVKKFLKSLDSQQPVFGVCLGMQLMVDEENGKVFAYEPPLHGKISKLQSELSGFNGLQVARYHSLKCELPESFRLLASSEEDRVPMWVEHKSNKWLGFQFHPESFMTEKSELYLNYLKHWCQL
jgi:anthranilate synthase/aminodeoxychorismate synthase-like glutamine amidotransferase